MKRASSIVAGLLLLLLAIAPTTSHTQHAASAGPLEQVTETADLPSRHTPITRSITQRGQATHLVQAGDTYGGMARTHCGTFNAWKAIAQANGWPERRIPIGATASIVCTVTAKASMPLRSPSPAPARIGGTQWVHPLASGRLGTSCYKTSTRPNHEGIDLPQPRGTAIRSAAAGTIYRKASGGTAGNYVTVNHGNGIFTQYHHMISASPLAVGAHVNAGQTIGLVGMTGNATGYHLHYEVMVGGYDHTTNPASFMRARGVNIGC